MLPEHNTSFSAAAMIEAQTKFFGSVAFDPESRWTFPVGLPGFEQEHEFLPLQRPGSEPVVFLQSLTDPELCFVTLPVNAVVPGYRLSPSPEDVSFLNLPPDGGLGVQSLCLAILTLSPGKEPTANLMSPLIVNVQSRRGMQVIQTETTYTHQHQLNLPSGAGPC